MRWINLSMLVHMVGVIRWWFHVFGSRLRCAIWTTVETFRKLNKYAGSIQWSSFTFSVASWRFDLPPYLSLAPWNQSIAVLRITSAEQLLKLVFRRMASAER
uniref:Uncharacterized protein n=1 Tax=Schistocephalus solidus TaxID=70667 RepID=A0A0X3NSP1_SCHSO